VSLTEAHEACDWTHSVLLGTLGKPLRHQVCVDSPRLFAKSLEIVLSFYRHATILQNPQKDTALDGSRL
jgi:hypothetical protein